MKRLFIGLIIIFISLSVSGCKSSCDDEITTPLDVVNTYGYLRQDFYGYLDTNSVIMVEYVKDKTNETKIKEHFQGVNQILLDIETEYSSSVTSFMKDKNITESTVMKVNANSGVSPVVVSNEFINTLKEAIEIADLTSGAYDPTIGALTSAWDISKRSEYCNAMISGNCEIPSREEIASLKTLVNYKDIVIDEINSTVYLKNKGMKLDFGSIAKGLAADKIMNYLKSDNYTYISVNLGGNVITSGKANLYNELTTTADIVPVGIENPFTNKFNQNTVLKVVESDITVVASGVSKRYIEVWDDDLGFVRYHHILNPFTGYPYKNEIETITIVGKSSMIADGLSTGMFSLGLDNAINVLKENNYRGIIITQDYKIYIVGNINYQLTDNVESVYTIIKK